MEITKVRLKDELLDELNPPAVLKVLGNKNQLRLVLRMLNEQFPSEYIQSIDRFPVENDKAEEMRDKLSAVKEELDEIGDFIGNLTRTL